jgi:oligopeptide/dipeptide ABC transporter ATP-binding protein
VAEANNIISTENLVKCFHSKGGLLGRGASNVKAVDGVSLGIRRGEAFGLVGESGCGKTTFGRTLMRLTDATEGKILFEGVDITKLRGPSLKQFRGKMQMVFQDSYASLDPRQNIRSALVEPMRIHHVVSTKSEANHFADELIERVGLNPDHLARFPHEFSGGQRQRVAIAVALAVKPSFILLDEPTSLLDVSIQAQIMVLLKNLQEELGLTYIIISHNLALIRQMCDRTAVMYLGRIVESAETTTIFQNPKHPYTKALLSAVPIPDPSKRKEFDVLQGDVPSPNAIPTGCRFRTRCKFATAKCQATDPPLVEVERNHWIECHYDIDLSASTRGDMFSPDTKAGQFRNVAQRAQ